MLPLSSWIYLWPNGLPNPPYRMTNLGAAHTIRRLGGSIMAEFHGGHISNIATGTVEQATEWMTGLATFLGAYIPEADPAMPAVQYPWILHTSPTQQRLINYRHWYEFWRDTGQQAPGTFKIMGARPGMYETLVEGVTEQQAFELLVALQVTSGSVPKPF
jgi:hypothetical protein